MLRTGIGGDDEFESRAGVGAETGSAATVSGLIVVLRGAADCTFDTSRAAG
ncbi:MAG: hypothetical protein WAM92_02940 [Mycobacterium sp.]